MKPNEITASGEELKDSASVAGPTPQAEEAKPRPEETGAETVAEKAEQPAEAAEQPAEGVEAPAEIAEEPAEVAEVSVEVAEESAEAAEEPAEVADNDGETRAEAAQDRKIFPVPASKTEVIERLREISHSGEPADRDEVDYLKKMYYRLRHEEVAAQREAFIDAGGNAEEFVPAPDTDEERFKAEMALVREKRAKELEGLEKRKQDNLARKLAILEQVKAFSASPEEANKNYDAFRKLQAEWKEANPVPPENSTELWKNYQYLVENFYDMLKLNNEFREYDFKKNLEAKLRLCENAEKLESVNDPVSAFHQLQKLHQEFREVGPVAKDLREQVWERFKAASTLVNKRHQEYFERQKGAEKDNLVKKTALCEKAEAMDTTGFKTNADWDNGAREIMAIQAEWKTIGFTPKSVNAKIYERFRAACDKFFKARTAYYRERRAGQQANYARKVALCEQAEAIKDSTDWATTMAKENELMEEWKTIGPVGGKQSDALWKRFSAASNAFYDAHRKATSSKREEEKKNLAVKQNIIAQLKEITAEAADEGARKVRELMGEWQNTGYVPYKAMDKVQGEYRAQIDRLYKELKMGGAARRVEGIKAQAAAALSRGTDTMMRERDRLFRVYEAKRSEIQTYENNLGFLNISSKSGNSFVDDIRRKIDNLKSELDGLREAIEEIDNKSKAAAPEDGVKPHGNAPSGEAAAEPQAESAE